MVIFTFLSLDRICKWYFVFCVEVRMVYRVARGVCGRLCISCFVTRLDCQCAHEVNVNIQMKLARSFAI